MKDVVITCKRNGFEVGDIVCHGKNGHLYAPPNSGTIHGQVVGVSGDVASVKILGAITCRYTGATLTQNAGGYAQIVYDGANGKNSVKTGTNAIGSFILEHDDSDPNNIMITYLKVY